MGSDLRIGLVGMYGLYNYGCEAIVRGTYKVIREVWPDSKVILYTFMPSEDAKKITDLNIELKPIPMKKLRLFRRIANKVLRVLSVDRQFSIWDGTSVVDDCDIVFSVGGDIYTVPYHLLQTGKSKAFNPLVELGKTVVRHCPMIVWGASIGPFGQNGKVKKYFLNHLKDMELIFCREKRTYDYLAENGFENIVLCPDPAFYVTQDEVGELINGKTKTRIGLNLSPLSAMETMGRNLGSFQENAVRLVKDLCTIPDAEVVLVPHVKSPLSNYDNDLVFLEQIHNAIPVTYRDNVDLIRNADDFLEAKGVLRTCDIVIAARMHCAVNALTEGIPTILLCYSQKGVGMSDYVYGDTYWAVQLNQINDEVLQKTIEMLERRDVISSHLRQRVFEIHCEKTQAVELLKSIKQRD